MAAATLAELEAVGRAGSAAGQAALWLAGLMDAGKVTGSQAAALADKHLRALEAAKVGARPVADPLDDLAARRRARAESA